MGLIVMFAMTMLDAADDAWNSKALSLVGVVEDKTCMIESG